MVVFLQLIVNDGAIFAVNHEDSLFDLDALNFISENRKRVETKLFQVAKSLWMHSVRITIRGQLERLPIDEKDFFQLREQDQPVYRRLGRGHQQAMIAARVQADDRRRGKAAQSVGFQPLTAKGRA